MKWIFVRVSNLVLLLALAACGSRVTPQATSEADSTTDNRPVAPSRDLQTSLPEVCDCVLRFDRLGIEEGLSQSSVNVIFQDSRGFLWFGTEDGLNRYDGYTFKIFKPEPNNPNSISSGWVTAIAEDQNGYLWIGTNLSGLNRYDPTSGQFTQYQNSDANPNKLIDNHIKALWVDQNNQVWIGTSQGLDRLEPNTEIFHHYPASDPLVNNIASDSQDATLDTDRSTYPGISTLSFKLSSATITAIHQDSGGSIWVGTLDGGLNVFDPQKNFFTIYQNIEEQLVTLSSNRITAIAEDKQGNLWVGTNNGLNLFNVKTGEFQRFTNNRDNPLSLADNTITTLNVDSAGNLWIGTANGLDRLSEDGTHFVHYRNDPSFSESLSNNLIQSIYEDRAGVLWFGTFGGGVNKYDWGRSRFAYYRHDPANPDSLSGNFIIPIHVDHQGIAWVGTSGAGLNRLNQQTGEIISYRNNPGNANSLGSNWVLSLAEDHQNNIWVGTINGLDHFDPAQNIFTHYRHDPSKPTSLSSNTIYSLYFDSNQTLWIGTSTGLDRFDGETGEFIHYQPDLDNPNRLSGVKPNVIVEDTQGNLWIGTSESGLNRFDPDTNTFRHYRHDPQDRRSISNDSILSIYQDSKGRLWVGTTGGGLNLYDPITESFTYYLEKDGLPNGVVYGILEDDFGVLWLSTNFGISRFTPETGVFRNFDAGDGLQSNEFNPNAYAKGLNGEFYFGGINGLTVFRPDEIADNPYKPQVVLTSLTQDDQLLSIGPSVETLQAITLEYPLNSFEFNFTALSYNQPEKNQYAYFLEGFDANWHFIGTKRDGRYTNLPGGEYTLLLKAANSDGVWNDDPTRIKVTIVPPYWQTNWFRGIVMFAIIVAVASGIRLRTRTIQDRNRALERLVRERTYALENRNREIEALYMADERILRNVSMNQVFQTLVDVAVDTLNANRSAVLAWDENQTKIVPRVSRGFSADTLKVMKFGRGEGAVGRVLETGEPIIVRQIELNEFRPDIRDALIAEGIRSFAHIPILVDEKIIAVFNVGFTKPNLIGDDITRLFSALTHRASITIANMELFEQTKDLAVMEERNRLARDLHDSAKQKAFAALAQLGTARGILNGNSDRVSIHLNEAENLVSDVIQELTFLIQEIYPIGLQEKGLAVTLREYIFEWENRCDAKVNLSIQNDRHLPLEIEQALYRVAQETLANVARHSQARNVDITLTYQDDAVQLSLSDDGLGFDMSTKPYGMGLRSIKDRVGSVRGTVQIQSEPGRGTRTIVHAPAKVKDGGEDG